MKCIYHGCNHTTWKLKKNNPEKIYFIPFPRMKKYDAADCKRWVEACCLDNEVSEMYRKLKGRHTIHICSKHFLGGNGPTRENPDPIKFSVCSFKKISGSSIRSLDDVLPPYEWILERTEDGSSIFSRKKKDVIILQLTVNPNLSFDLKIRNMPAAECVMKNLPNVESIEDVPRLIETLHLMKVCTGNNEVFMTSAFLKDVSNKTKGKYCEMTKSVYSISCSQITKKSLRCSECTHYRYTLRSLVSKLKRNRNSLRNMTRSQLIAEVKLTKAKKTASEVALSRLIRQVRKSQIRGGTNEELEKILKEHLKSAIKNSFLSTMLKDQLKQLKRKDKGRRYHPEFLKWATYLKNKSTSAYDIVRKSGLIMLPNKKTLYNESLKESKHTGIHDDVFEDMIEKANLKNLEEHQKFFVLTFDEMSIREDVIYQPHTGDLIGFVKLNDICDRLTRAETNNAKPEIAKHVLQFMLRGVTSSFQYSFCHYATSSLKGPSLSIIIWEIIQKLEIHGFKILAIACDGHPTNRSFFEMCAKSEKNSTEIQYCTKNLYALDEQGNTEDRDIYFVSDAPHLIKTARNGLSSSGQNKKKFPRLLWNDGQVMEWSTIRKAYMKEVRTGVKLLHKLSYNHINLQSFSKMRVSYATQVLSASVATAIETFYGKSKFSKTVEFLRIFNKYFDIVNVRHRSEGVMKRNPDLKPFESPNDPRLEWLTVDFIAYLDDWETSVNNRPEKYTKSEKQKMMLPPQTIKGLKMTALSSSAIIKFILGKGAKFVLSGHWNQDPLEAEFGQHRAACGSSDNPTVFHYGHNVEKFKDIGAVFDVRGANCEKI